MSKKGRMRRLPRPSKERDSLTCIGDHERQMVGIPTTGRQKRGRIGVPFEPRPLERDLVASEEVLHLMKKEPTNGGPPPEFAPPT